MSPRPLSRTTKWLPSSAPFDAFATDPAAGLAAFVPKHPYYAALQKGLAEYRKLLDQATARHLCVQMGYMLRCNPAFRFCFQALREGWLGKIFEVHGVMAKLAPLEERRQDAPFRQG